MFLAGDSRCDGEAAFKAFLGASDDLIKNIYGVALVAELDGHEIGFLEFQQALYNNGWVTPAFDWSEWQESAEEFVDSPEKAERADATTIQKLLTIHFRKDRLCEGHLTAMFENGRVVALLRRLKAIRVKMKA